MKRHRRFYWNHPCFPSALTHSTWPSKSVMSLPSSISPVLISPAIPWSSPPSSPRLIKPSTPVREFSPIPFSAWIQCTCVHWNTTAICIRLSRHRCTRFTLRHILHPSARLQAETSLPQSGKKLVLDRGIILSAQALFMTGRLALGYRSGSTFLSVAPLPPSTRVFWTRILLHFSSPSPLNCIGAMRLKLEVSIPPTLECTTRPAKPSDTASRQLLLLCHCFPEAKRPISSSPAAGVTSVAV
mmetsp:Transcript_45759/g.76386  ORF Transcript_45759/g.76386 Transcript_45759/m.76386 type:complete len:242 (+) Transcript_45759:3-728(+)